MALLQISYLIFYTVYKYDVKSQKQKKIDLLVGFETAFFFDSESNRPCCVDGFFTTEFREDKEKERD